jgi:hypothetical protein
MVWITRVEKPISRLDVENGVDELVAGTNGSRKGDVTALLRAEVAKCRSGSRGLPRHSAG